MSSTAPVRRLIEAGYLNFDRKVEVKHEFFVGGLFASVEFQPATVRPAGV
jgi:hypothetical protein